MAGQVAEVTDANFAAEVLKSETPVIIDFWAAWCGPCKVMTPVIEQLAGKYAGKIKFAKMNVDDNPQTPSKYAIRSIPTLLFFKNGEVVNQTVGVTSPGDLSQKIDTILG